MLKTSDLEKFVDEFGDHAYNFAFSLAGDEEEARELVQASFVKLFENAAEFDGARALDSWLFTVLKHMYFDSRRRAAWRLSLSLDTPVGEGGLTVADAVADEREEAVIDRLEREESRAHLRRALDALPGPARALLTMVDIEGMTYEAAAEVLGCPLNTVRSRLSRARVLLRERLLAMEVAA